MSASILPQNRLDRLFQRMGPIPTLATLDGYFVDPSPRWTALLGWSREELSSRPFVDFVHPDDVPSTLEKAGQLSEGIDVVSFDNRYSTRDGDWVWIRWHSSADLDAGRIYALATDITADKLAHRSLERNEGLLSDMGSIAQVGGWELNLRTGELFWLPEVFRIHELPLGTPPPLDQAISFYPGEAANTIREAIETALELRQMWDLELPFVTAKGNHRWVRALGRPHVEGDEVVRLSGAFQDITAAKQREQELRDAREAALESVRFKSQFLANMSHEIRTPLNGIIGTLDLVDDFELPPEAIELLEIAHDCGENLLAIVNDILALARIEAGGVQLENVELDVRELVSQTTQTFGATASAKGLALEIAFGTQLATAYHGDPTRIRQVLNNLVGNAVKFTTTGSVRIRVDEPADGRVRIEVADTGPGINTAHHHTVFQAFRQADNTVTRRHGGTGLGLAICRQLVELMGGTIGLDSEEGRGSTFWFEVPLQPVRTTAVTAPRQAPTTRSQGALRILLAEDNDINALVAERTLRLLGHDLVRVCDGQQALDALTTASRAYDLVLMDVQMPRLDGIETTRRVRQWEASEARPPTPIIALTANVLVDDVERCSAAGMNGHLSKPFRRSEVIRCLEGIAAQATPSP